MWRWLAAILHRDRAAFDLRSNALEAYRLLYAYKPSAAQADRILRLELNRGAAGCLERFGPEAGP